MVARVEPFLDSEGVVDLEWRLVVLAVLSYSLSLCVALSLCVCVCVCVKGKVEGELEL